MTAAAPRRVPLRLSRRARTVTGTIATLAVLGPLFVWLYQRSMPALYDRSESEPDRVDYPPAAPQACAPGTRLGPAGGSPREESPDGVRYLVRTPSNYDPTRAHPLIVVYAPHGANRFLSERYVGLTRSATRAGYVIAYADHHGLDRRALRALGRLPSEIPARWCIDPERVFFTGHSDGATAAVALVVLGLATPNPAAIAASAAGFRGEDLAAYACPAPLPVLVLHSRNDELFPGFGRQALAWWLACDRCPSTAERSADGCEFYTSCGSTADVAYCEGSGAHIEWPHRNDRILEFFHAAGERSGPRRR